MGRISSGRADWTSQDDGYEPYVGWQIPAIGDRELSIEQAERLAGYLERNDDEFMEFILLGEDPKDVAEELRRSIESAKAKAQRRNDR